MNASAIVRNNTAPKTTIGIVFARGLKSFAPFGCDELLDDRAVGVRDAVLALPRLEIGLECFHAALRKGDRTLRRRRDHREIDQRQQSARLVVSERGRQDLSRDVAPRSDQSAHLVARREVGIEDRQRVEAIGIGDRDAAFVCGR